MKYEIFIHLLLLLKHFKLNIENLIIYEIFGPEVQYHYQNAIKDFIIPNQYNKMHIEQTYLHALSHVIRKLEWI